MAGHARPSHIKLEQTSRKHKRRDRNAQEAEAR